MESNTLPSAAPKGTGEKRVGIVGAWFGAIIGSIPMLIAALTVRTLTIPLAALIPVFSQYLYRKLGGYRKLRTAVITIITVSLVSLVFMRLIGESLALSRTPSWQASAAEYGMKPFEFAWAALLMTENFRLLIPSLVLSAAVCITGVVVVYPFIKDYADMSAEEEAGLKELDRKNEAEAAKKAIEERSEKRKKMPQRLERFASEDPDKKIIPKGEYRVSPDPMQKKYLGIAAVIAALLGAVLFAGCIYMTVQGSLQYVVFSLACIALIVVAVRVMFSLSRYVDIDGTSLKARGIKGKVTEFSFDDISLCERDEKRLYLKGKDGQSLAFFNIGWENARRLFNAIEGYGIDVLDVIKQ